METNDTLSEWEAFVERQPLKGKVRPFVLESWRRSLREGVEANTVEPTFRKVSEEELQRRRERGRELITLTEPHLQWLSAVVGAVTHVAYLTDRDGIVLMAYGDPDVMEADGLTPGHDWSERQLGTNGAGTALVIDQPVAIVGAEHYTQAFHNSVCTAAPIHDSDGKILGAIDLSTPVADGTPDRLGIVAHIAFAIETEAELRRQQAEAQRRAEQLQALATQVTRADHRERRRVAQFLHEQLQQILVAARLHTEMLSSTDRKTVDRAMRQVREQLDEAINRSRSLSQELCPAILYDRGIAEAIQWLGRHYREQHSLEVDVSVSPSNPPLPEIDQELQAFLFHSVRELVANALKHGKASRVSIEMAYRDRSLNLHVRDNGQGFESTRLDNPSDGVGLGLSSIRERLGVLGGSMRIESRPGKGCAVTLVSPI